MKALFDGDQFVDQQGNVWIAHDETTHNQGGDSQAIRCAFHDERRTRPTRYLILWVSDALLNAPSVYRDSIRRRVSAWLSTGEAEGELDCTKVGDTA